MARRRQLEASSRRHERPLHQRAKSANKSNKRKQNRQPRSQRPTCLACLLPRPAILATTHYQCHHRVGAGAVRAAYDTCQWAELAVCLGVLGRVCVSVCVLTADISDASGCCEPCSLARSPAGSLSFSFPACLPACRPACRLACLPPGQLLCCKPRGNNNTWTW